MLTNTDLKRITGAVRLVYSRTTLLVEPVVIG